METPRHRVRTKPAAPEATADEVGVDLETPEPTRHPMGSVGVWMADFGFFGAVSALVHGVLQIGHGMEPFWILFFVLLVGIQGLLAGLAVGGLLRFLRGRIPAGMGLMVAVVGAWAATSLVPWFLGGQVGLSSTLRGLPYTLAVTVLIPLLAVFRARGKKTLPWLAVAGLTVGVSLGPWAEVVRAYLGTVP